MTMNSQNNSHASVERTRAEKRVQRPTEPLTDTERAVLLGLERAIHKHGNPSLREIAEAAGPKWYASSAHKYLRRLAVKGFVAMPTTPGRMRSIRLIFSAPPLRIAKRKAVAQ
jgi:SOS-response transcriptional repressor LexA